MRILPVLLCGIGAAINRMRIGLRHRVNTSFWYSSLMYATGLYNYCLLVQERDLDLKKPETQLN